MRGGAERAARDAPGGAEARALEAIAERLARWRSETQAAQAELRGEMAGRFDGLEAQLKRLCDGQERLVGRLSLVERDAASAAAGGDAWADDGLPFRRGRLLWLGAAAVAVSLLGGLQKAAETIGGFFVHVGQMFGPPPAG